MDRLKPRSAACREGVSAEAVSEIMAITGPAYALPSCPVAAWSDESPAGIVVHPQSVDNSGHGVRDSGVRRKPTWSRRRGARRGDPGAWNRRSRRGVGSHALNAGVVARSAFAWELAGSCCVMLAIRRCHHLPGTGSIDRHRLEDPAALNVDALLGGRYGPVGFYTAKQIPKASQRRLPPGPVISACDRDRCNQPSA